MTSPRHAALDGAHLDDAVLTLRPDYRALLIVSISTVRPRPDFRTESPR